MYLFKDKLQALVKHVEEELYQIKLDKYEDMKNKIETDKIAEQDNVLRETEK